MATAPLYNDYTMGWLTKELFNSQQEQEIFSALKHSNQTLGPSTLLLNAYWGSFPQQ
jgi:hypothetical protein